MAPPSDSSNSSGERDRAQDADTAGNRPPHRAVAPPGTPSRLPGRGIGLLTARNLGVGVRGISGILSISRVSRVNRLIAAVRRGLSALGGFRGVLLVGVTVPAVIVVSVLATVLDLVPALGAVDGVLDGVLVTGLVHDRTRRLALRCLRLGTVLPAPPIPPAGVVVIAELSHEAISFPRRRGSAATRGRAQTAQIT